MTRDTLFESLQGKRIGLVSCTALEGDIARALKHVQVSFAIVQANLVDPAAAELDRFDAVMLGVANRSADSPWLRPEVLRTHTRPLLLAGAPEAIYCRETLQSCADDVILSPFLGRELLFRLHRITGGRRLFREPVVRSGKRIVLIVDDDRSITDYLESVLQKFNAEVHVATDGKSGLGVARQLLPDLLLLDIGLPNMNGLEVLRCLRDDPGTSDLATVLLTASSDPVDVEDGARLGVSDYILKPFGHVDLIRKLKALLPFRLPLPEAPATAR